MDEIKYYISISFLEKLVLTDTYGILPSFPVKLLIVSISPTTVTHMTETLS